MTRKRYSEKAKLAAVKAYLESHRGMRATAEAHGVGFHSLRGWVAGYQAHGVAGINEKPRKAYDPEFKLEVLARIREEGLSYRQAGALFGVRRFDQIGAWERAFRQEGVAGLATNRGRTMKKKMAGKPDPGDGHHDRRRSREDLLRGGSAASDGERLPKRIGRLSSGQVEISAHERTLIVLELTQHFPLGGLLRLTWLPRGTFYTQQRALACEDKHGDLKASIRAIFDQHKGLYDYRRVTAALRLEGHVVNHKTVQRLMCQMQLRSRVRAKKFRRFAGQGSHVAPDLLKRDFTASKPNEKWVTDVTEFSVGNRKLYLSHVMDLYNGEILAYDTSETPVLGMVENMLARAFERLGPSDRPILHSDQGWQYRMSKYHRHRAKVASTEYVEKRKLLGQRRDRELLRHAQVRVLPSE